MHIDWQTVTAIYAAVLSTVLAARSWRGDRRWAKVTLSYGIPIHDRSDKIFLLISVSNPGKQPITITGAGIQLPNKGRIFLPPVPAVFDTLQFPQELRPGNGSTFWLDPRQVAEALKRDGLSGNAKIRGFCNDATGKSHLSKAMEFNIESRLIEE